ncbi:MAG: hypothetical protein ACRBN8_18700 [Nannocystales bacterium]
MLAPARLLLVLLPATVLACSDSRLVEETDPETAPEVLADDECPHWLLVERTGDFPVYERRTYDDQARLIRHETGGHTRSLSGEHHSVTEISYGDGLVTSVTEERASLDDELVHRVTEVTELDVDGRPVRIHGWDSLDLMAPNRTVSLEYDAQGRLSLHHQDDEYANGGVVDRACSYTYDTQGQLSAKICEGTNPDTKHYGWDDNGNLLFSELEAETFTHRADYTYDGMLLTSLLADDFARYAFGYDEAGRLVSHEYERFDGLGDAVDEYEYDPQGRMERHVATRLDGSHYDTTVFHYDPEGRLLEAASERTPRSYAYEQSGDELTVTERWGKNLHETRSYLCSPTPATGLPADTNPEPFGGADRILPTETVEPQPFPTGA